MALKVRVVPRKAAINNMALVKALKTRVVSRKAFQTRKKTVSYTTTETLPTRTTATKAMIPLGFTNFHHWERSEQPMGCLEGLLGEQGHHSKDLNCKHNSSSNNSRFLVPGSGNKVTSLGSGRDPSS